MTRFTIDATAGDAKAGTLEINGIEMETPHLFPVVNFYGGGLKDAYFGGGIHRTVKEFMMNEEEVVNNDYSDLFQGIMTSVSSLTDFSISRDKLDYYLQKRIRDWDKFSDFDGLIFLDSGGFKIMTEGALKGDNFEMEIDQRKALELQRKIGGDIIVNLDHPILPDDGFKAREEKGSKTADNAKKFIELSQDFDGARYLTAHGYNYSMLDRFFDEVQDRFEQDISEVFDGIALGSLVPKKDDYETLIDAVTSCKEIMEERGMEDMPLHVLGISSSSIPLLVTLGADTFDSSTYIHNAINGNYMTSLTDSVRLEDADFSECNCRVCNNKEMRKRMRGGTEYKKDQYGAVAIHNIEVQRREISKLRESINKGDDALKKHIEETVGNKPGIKKFAYRVVNTSIEEYF